jgi:hypothetical protein
MTNPNNWPDPAKPGHPLNPEQDGWHWLRHRDASFCTPVEWRVPCGWVTNNIPMLPKEVQSFVVDCCEYLGPCLTPAEVAVREQAVSSVACRLNAEELVKVMRLERRVQRQRRALSRLYARRHEWKEREQAARREGMEEAAKEVDCGCAARQDVLRALADVGERRAKAMCLHGYVCCALQAAAIRAAAKENNDE